MKVQVLYLNPKTRWPIDERLKIPMKMMLAARLGAYPREEPSAGQSGPIILHCMSAMLSYAPKTKGLNSLKLSMR